MVTEVFDKNSALAAFGKDSILKAVVTIYLEEAEFARARLEESLTSQDLGRLRETAHWLKGGFSTLHAPAAREAAASLEAACDREASFEEMDPLARRLLEEMDRLREHLNGQEPV